MIRRRNFAALAALLSLGATAACSPSRPADPRDAYCESMADSPATIQARADITQNKQQLTRIVRNVIENDEFRLEPAYDNVHLIMRVNAETGEATPIELGQRRGTVTLPNGTRRNYTYPIYAALNEDDTYAGEDADGNVSYGLFAAPREQTFMVTHDRMNGITQTPGETVPLPLTAAMRGRLPEHLRDPGAQPVSDTALQRLSVARTMTIESVNRLDHVIFEADKRVRRAQNSAGSALATYCATRGTTGPT